MFLLSGLRVRVNKMKMKITKLINDFSYSLRAKSSPGHFCHYSIILGERFLLHVRLIEGKQRKELVVLLAVFSAEENGDLVINWLELRNPTQNGQISISLSEINIKFKVWKRCKEGILLKEHQEFITTGFCCRDKRFFFSISVRFA